MLSTGLLGHVIAAILSGGSAVAYLHHIVGFFIILAVTSVLVIGMARLFWRGRTDITVLVISTVQALMGGLVVYLERGGA